MTIVQIGRLFVKWCKCCRGKRDVDCGQAEAQADTLHSAAASWLAASARAAPARASKKYCLVPLYGLSSASARRFLLDDQVSLKHQPLGRAGRAIATAGIR